MELDHFEGVEKPILPVAGESLLDFLMRQHGAKGDVSISPRCSAVFDRNTVRVFKKRKLEHEITEREAKKEQLRRKVAGKQKKYSTLGRLTQSMSKLKPV